MTDLGPNVQIDHLVEHLFRHQAGQMLASLTRIFGLEHLDLAEDVVQEALLQALRQWPFSGVPENPRAWLIHVARNKALDALRRRALHRRVEQDLRAQLEQFQPAADFSDTAGLDEQVAMMFACCHPALSRDAQVALTLKAVSCLSVGEIARAFLAEPTTIAQRLVRAKRRLKTEKIALEVPSWELDPARLDSVLQVLYLVFNEGYAAHVGENLVREDLCLEAIRLTKWLAEHPATNAPNVHALLALFYLQAARLSTRLDRDGNLLLLAEQDRTLWNSDWVRRGLEQLELSASGVELSEYHLQAGIAAIHVTSSSFQNTDWPSLLHLYDLLMTLVPSPVIALNRAVALSMVDGPEAGLRLVERLCTEPSMRSYRFLPAVRADMLRRLGRLSEAAQSYCQALDHSCTEPERRFLLGRLEAIDGSTDRAR